MTRYVVGDAATTAVYLASAAKLQGYPSVGRLAVNGEAQPRAQLTERWDVAAPHPSLSRMFCVVPVPARDLADPAKTARLTDSERTMMITENANAVTVDLSGTADAGGAR